MEDGEKKTDFLDFVNTIDKESLPLLSETPKEFNIQDKKAF